MRRDDCGSCIVVSCRHVAVTDHSLAVQAGSDRLALLIKDRAGLVLFFVPLNLEAYALLIGSLLLFVALAVVIWATRQIDWSAKRELAEEANASAT